MTINSRLCSCCLGLIFLCIAPVVLGFDVRVERSGVGQPVGLSFDTAPGIFYDVETSTNLLSWQVLRTIRAQSAQGFVDLQSGNDLARFYRVADLSGNIVVEGTITSPDGRGVPDHCPFCDILVSSSLDGATAYTDENGRYILRTETAASVTNLPFTLYFSKIGFRAHSSVVTDPTASRVEVMTLAGPSNNDFANRVVITGSATNVGDNALSDVEDGENAEDGSVWYSFSAPRAGTLRFVVDTTEFLPSIQIFKGQSLPLLEPLQRSVVSNYVEWRIEVTHDLSVRAGEQLQIRVGALPHPTRDLVGGPFEWRAVFEADFPLVVENENTNRGTVMIHPPPKANGRYAPGTQVRLTAVPGASHSFAGWSGSVEAPNPQIVVTMDGAKKITAQFLLDNGDIANATVLTQPTPAGEAYIPLDSVVWYSWTPARLTPTIIRFHATNVFFSTLYRRDGTNLTFVTDNRKGYEPELRFWASNGVTYVMGVHLEPNQAGTLRFTSFEPIVMQGIVVGPYQYFVTGQSSTVTFSGGFSASWFSNRYEIWTAQPTSPAHYPYTVTVSAAAFRPASGTVRAMGDLPVMILSYTGPSNNDFTNSVAINPPGGHVSATLNYSDTEVGEKGIGPGSIWYKFTAPEGGTLRIANNTRAAWETTLWTGNSLASLQQQPSWILNQDIYGIVTEQSVPGGVTSYLRFGGYNRPLGNVSFSYSFTPGYPLRLTNAHPQAGSVFATPLGVAGRYAENAQLTVWAVPRAGYRFAGWSGDVASSNTSAAVVMTGQVVAQANFALRNDHFEDRISIAGLPVTARGTNLYGTAQPGEPSHAGFPAASSAWWRWIAPVSGDVVMDFDFLDVTIAAAVYTGNSLSTIVHVANNNEGRDVRKIRFRAVAGVTYRIAVDAHGEGGPYEFTIRPVPEARYTLQFEPADGGYAVPTPEPDGNSEYATGTTVTLRAVALNPWAFSHWEDTSSGTAVILGTNETLQLVMNRDRRIVPRFVRVGEPRFNDSFADRLLLRLPSEALVVNNTAATVDAGEPEHATNASGRSVWWSWTAPLQVPVAFTTSGSGIDNVLAVYKGNRLEDLTLVARRENEAGELGQGISLLAEAATTYHIVVDGLHGQTGEIWLRAVLEDAFTLELPTLREEESRIAPGYVLIAAEAFNSDLTVTQLTLFTNGVAAISTTNSGASMAWSNLDVGVYTVRATARDAHGRSVSVGPYTIGMHQYFFASNSFIGREREGVATIRVRRAGPTNIASRIYFDLADGTALRRQQYVPCAGNIVFLPGETEVTVTVSLLVDDGTDVTRSFMAMLRPSVGAPPIETVPVNLYDSFVTGDSTGAYDDSFPLSAAASGDFVWIENNPVPASGTKARESTGVHEVSAQWSVVGDAYRWQEVYIDPVQPPGLIAITVQYGGFYSRTVCLGDRMMAEPSDVWLGPLPEAGSWWRLIVPNSVIGTVPVQRVKWTVIGGRAVWDRFGTTSRLR